MLRLDLLSVTLLGLALLPLRRLSGPLVWAGLLAVLAHMAVEGVRWQMAPVYAVLLAWPGVLLGRMLPGVPAWTPGPWLAGIGRAAGVASVLTALAASYLFPMFRLPTPTGPFAIGTRTYSLADSSRYERHTVEPFDRRELMVRVWYPATAPEGGAPASYMDDADRLGPAVAKGYGLPFAFVFSHLNRVASHAYRDAPLSNGRATYPVLVFSHGRDVYAAANTVLMEEMASRGYVVFAIDHAYGSTASVFPDGRVASFVGDVYEQAGPRPAPSPSQIALMVRAEKAVAGFEPKAIVESASALNRMDPRGSATDRFGLAIWVADQRFVLDEVGRMAAGTAKSPFAGRLDLSRLGVFGMSYGGAATVVTCAVDPRCKAGVDLDGFTTNLLTVPAQPRPFLFASSGDQNLNLALADRALGGSYWMKVDTSKHGDFTDLPLVTRGWKYAGLSGSIAPERMLALTNAYVGAFFDKHLMGVPAPLLDGRSGRYPEVRLQVKPPARGAGAVS